MSDKGQMSKNDLTSLSLQKYHKCFRNKKNLTVYSQFKLVIGLILKELKCPILHIRFQGN